jgi:hypothetical protein
MMELGVHLPLIQFGDEGQSLGRDAVGMRVAPQKRERVLADLNDVGLPAAVIRRSCGLSTPLRRATVAPTRGPRRDSGS